MQIVRRADLKQFVEDVWGSADGRSPHELIEAMNSGLLDFNQFAEELFGEVDLRVVLNPRRATLQLPNPRQFPYCGKIAALGALLPFEDEL
jgi:hypothetical protein